MLPAGAEGMMGDDDVGDDEGPVLKVGEEREIGEQGLKKKLLKEGEGLETPEIGDEVEVKYEARLEDGTVVSKSEGVEFTVEAGYFCPALAKAVKTMKKAEKVLLTVKPQYGFGEKGRPAAGEEGAVPPNATLLIDLELVSLKTVTEIRYDKKVLKAGEGEFPKEGAVVKVKITGKLQDGTVFTKKGHDEETFEFKTDEEEVIDGLDRAVLNMKKTEIALVTIHPEYAFGSTESKQDLAVVPPNSTVIYEVELVSFVKDKEPWDLNNKEKIQAAGEKKEEGNTLFKMGKYARASKRYKKAVDYIMDDVSFNANQRKQSNQLKISCNLNNAACKLKLKDYDEAVKLCTKVLELDSENVKALYRREQAYYGLGYLELAEADIMKALKIEPDNKELKSEHNTLKDIREYIERETVMTDRHERYEIMEYKFHDVPTLLVCDGPEGPSLLTTLFNFLHCAYGWVRKPLRPYFEKYELRQRMLSTLLLMSTFDGGKKSNICKQIGDLGPDSYVTPVLNRHCDFKESPVTDFFLHLGVPLVHCWLVDPEDASVYRIIQNYSYEELQKYSAVLEKKMSGDDVHKHAIVQKLLETHNKQMTCYGYTSLCENLEENAITVLYWDNKFHVVHMRDGSLLFLETNSSILKDYPEVRWRVFEEVDRDTIYLNDHFMPAHGQPNVESAMLWHQSKVPAKKPLSKGQRKRQRNQANKEAGSL